MNIDKLKKLKVKHQIGLDTVGRILEKHKELSEIIEGLEYLTKHAGNMIFTGNSGKIGERDIMLRTISINTISGCVAVPEFILSLARKALVKLEIESLKVGG